MASYIILSAFFNPLTYCIYGLIILFFNVKTNQVDFLIVSHHVTPNVMCGSTSTQLAGHSARQYKKVDGSTTGSISPQTPPRKPIFTAEVPRLAIFTNILPIFTAERAYGRRGGPQLAKGPQRHLPTTPSWKCQQIFRPDKIH